MIAFWHHANPVDFSGAFSCCSSMSFGMSFRSQIRWLGRSLKNPVKLRFIQTDSFNQFLCFVTPYFQIHRLKIMHYNILSTYYFLLRMQTKKAVVIDIQVTVMELPTFKYIARNRVPGDKQWWSVIGLCDDHRLIIGNTGFWKHKSGLTNGWWVNQTKLINLFISTTSCNMCWELHQVKVLQLNF